MNSCMIITWLWHPSSSSPALKKCLRFTVGVYRRMGVSSRVCRPRTRRRPRPRKSYSSPGASNGRTMLQTNGGAA
jgi:hypothetical protein